MFLNSLKFIRTVNHCKSMCAMYRCNDVKYYSALNSACSKQFGLLSSKPIMNNHDIRTMFIETQDTPNPNSLKFLPGTKVLEPGQSFDFVNIEAADCSPLAKMLFSIEGVKRVMFGPDFITIIKKDDNVDWTLVKPKVSALIMDFYASGSPVLNNAKPSGKTKINEDDDKTVKMVKELLDTKIRVIMHEHGGDVQFVDFKDGVLRLKMQGTCSSCPNSIDTLKNGVTNMMQFYVPEVLEVKQIDDGDKLSEKVHK